MAKVGLVFFVNFVLQIIFVKSYGPYFKMTKIECRDVNKSLLHVNVCRLKAVKRDITEATVRVLLLKPVDNCNIHIELLRKYNSYQPFFINNTFDVCAFFKRRKNSIYLDILVKLIENYTNANHTCPYEGEFIVEKFRPLHNNLILPIPSGDYCIKFSFYTSDTLLIQLNVWFSFKELEKLNISQKKKGEVKTFVDSMTF